MQIRKFKLIFSLLRQIIYIQTLCLRVRLCVCVCVVCLWEREEAGPESIQIEKFSTWIVVLKWWKYVSLASKAISSGQSFNHVFRIYSHFRNSHNLVLNSQSIGVKIVKFVYIRIHSLPAVRVSRIAQFLRSYFGWNKIIVRAFSFFAECMKNEFRL